MSALPSESEICAFLDDVESTMKKIKKNMLAISSKISRKDIGWSMETKGLRMITSLHYREGV